MNVKFFRSQLEDLDRTEEDIFSEADALDEYINFDGFYLEIRELFMTLTELLEALKSAEIDVDDFLSQEDDIMRQLEGLSNSAAYYDIEKYYTKINLIKKMIEE